MIPVVITVTGVAGCCASLLTYACADLYSETRTPADIYRLVKKAGNMEKRYGAKLKPFPATAIESAFEAVNFLLLIICHSSDF